MNLPDINQSPRLIVFREQRGSAGASSYNYLQDGSTRANSGLRLLTSHKPFSSAVLEYLANGTCNGGRLNILAIPSRWRTDWENEGHVVRYTARVPFSPAIMSGLHTSEWLIVSNGRFFSVVGKDRLAGVLAHRDVDVLAVDVDPVLAFYGEMVSHTSQGKVAGFRRSYQDSAVPTAMPSDWPIHLLIRRAVAESISAAGGLQIQFRDFVDWATSRGFVLGSVKVGGAVLDLEKEPDLLGVLRRIAGIGHDKSPGRRTRFDINGRKCKVDPTARLFGRVICGSGIRIGAGAVVSGPVVLGNNVKVGAGAVVRNSVIAEGLAVPEGAVLENRVIEDAGQLLADWPEMTGGVVHAATENKLPAADPYCSPGRFKIWPLFSYARFWKRLFDISTAIVVLILFLPVAPFVALAIKFTSSGPVFFRDRRQGLHGRHFNCLKFRTMISDASRLQEPLRKLNQVEGPQFSIKDDPRTNAVGRFLRETFIDEVPQFLNVLLGQMSVIGPRPSPQSENTHCPRWRDARLSVRPGITGLWQVCRTRAWGRDFQEWIKYDVTYVRVLSLKMDLWICWRTASKILRGFVKQLTK